MKQLLFISLLLLTGIAFAEYSENFDVAGNWFGNTSSYDNPAYYTNNAAWPAGDKFSSNYAERETDNYRSAPYAWRIATYADSYFRYECEVVMSNFSFWFAREASPNPPDINIRYSNNNGSTWKVLYNGSTFFNGISDLTYTQYVSPHLDVTPKTDKKIYIEIYKFSGARILVDDFELNHTVADPVDFSASQAPLQNEIDLDWTKNAAGDNVMIASSSTNELGTPVYLKSYAVGKKIPGGGTVVYIGSDLYFTDSGLLPNTEYFYKAWSVDTDSDDDPAYSSGVTASATTAPEPGMMVGLVLVGVAMVRMRR